MRQIGLKNTTMEKLMEKGEREKQGRNALKSEHYNDEKSSKKKYEG